MTDRTFFRTVYIYEVLSEEQPGHMSLSQIEEECTYGHSSGCFLTTICEEINGAVAARLLEDQGSSSEFFSLTPRGEDCYEA